MQLNRTPNALSRTDQENLNKNWALIEEAINEIGPAAVLAELAKRAADNVQAQVNALVIEGDSSVEARQARVDANGIEASTLKERLDKHQQIIALQLEEKASRSEIQAIASTFKESYNTLALLQAAYPTGDSSNHAVLSDGFIYTYKNGWISSGILANGTGVARGTITPEKLSFTALPAKKSKNLFNKATVSTQSYLVDATGAIFTLDGYFTSDFIVVEPSVSYANTPVTSMTRVSFYDINKKYLSRAADALTTFTTPANAYYIRVSYSNAALNTAQLEKGTVSTPFEENGIFFDTQTIKEDSFENAEIFKDGAISLNKLSTPVVQGKQGKNLFNKENIETGKYFNQNTGATFEIVGYFASEFIGVTPSTNYHLQATAADRRIIFYTANKIYVGYIDGASSFSTPTNAYFIRYASRNVDLENSQIEKGSVFTEYETAGVKIGKESLTGVSVVPKVMFTLNDAWLRWLRGDKFPIAIAGDSTVDGVGTGSQTEHLTAGTIDNKNPNAFTFLLEGIMKTATNNPNLRIYNAGHSGMYTTWALANIEAEFAGASVYADVKMVGIGYGINDRQRYSNEKAYRDGFKDNVKKMIEWFYGKGIQPFLITTQAIVEAGVISTQASTYPLRTSEAINSVANEVKKELAKEYNLELIDVNKFTEKFLQYSSYSIQQVIPDKLHFGNIGHKYESGLFFAHISPRTITVVEPTQLDYSNQRVVTAVPSDKLTLLQTLTDSFKILADYSKGESSDTKIMNFWVFVDAKRKMTLRAHKSKAESLTYVKVNGVRTDLTSIDTNLGDLDLGLYQLEVFTGTSDKVDFKGFKLS